MTIFIVKKYLLVILVFDYYSTVKHHYTKSI